MSSFPAMRSAVLLLMFDRDDETYLVFTRRTNDVATHKGQISFPGGRWEDFDSSLLDTALRETEEELGIPRDSVEVVAQLDVVPTVVSNFDISPFVGRLPAPPIYQPDPREVAEVLEVPLSVLRRPDIFWTEERHDREVSRQVYFFKYGEHVIWGATARIVRQFLQREEGGTTPD